MVGNTENKNIKNLHSSYIFCNNIYRCVHIYRERETPSTKPILVHLKLTSLNPVSTLKMCAEKVAEKFLKLLLSVPESITQTVASKVLRTSRLQRAPFEMLFCICRNLFQSFKGMVTGWTVSRHRHYLETLDQRFSKGRGAAVIVGLLSWLVCLSGLVSI